MPESRWKDALWKLLEVLPLQPITARVALSAGLFGLATQVAPDAAAQPRVPVSPLLMTPEATVRKFKGRYVLKRAANSFFVHLAGHRSHSSHASHGSHGSHSSHSSSTHYSGSHFSSSPSPPRSAPVAPPEPAPVPPPQAKPQPLLRDEFDTRQRLAGQWTVGILATSSETFDPNISTEQTGGLLSITPVAQKPGAHFSGYISIPSFDLNKSSIAVELRRSASGATTIFAAAIDSANWVGFRIEGGQLSIESHTKGNLASRKVAYSAAQHRFLRLRTSSVAPVVVWETSADGANWNPEYVETASIQVTALRIALSAGTTKSVPSSGPATFDSVIVERKP